MRKRFVAVLLVITMVCALNVQLNIVSASEQVEITSPSDGSWLDAWNDDIVVKWTKPSSGQSCKITILNVGENKDIVRNKSVSGTSYKIPAGTFGFEEKYKVWVGTFENGEAIGAGDSIIFYTLPADECINEAYISNYNNGDWVDGTEKITLKLADTNSKLYYRITIKNDVTGEYITQNELITGSSYTIPAYELDYENRYVMWIGTYTSKNINDAIGKGKSIKVNVNAAEVIPAEFTYPKNGDEIEADSDLKLKWSDKGNIYSISLRDLTLNEMVFERVDVKDASYTVSGNDLVPGHEYKVWIGTYIDDNKSAIYGEGDSVEFTVEEIEEPEENEAPSTPTPEPSADEIEIDFVDCVLEDDYLTMEYEITGDNFDYVEIKIKDNKGNVVYEDEHYKQTKKVEIDFSDEQRGVYTYTITAFDKNQTTCKKDGEFEKKAESGFSIKEPIEFPATLNVGESFVLTGVIGSAYPIEAIEIVVFSEETGSIFITYDDDDINSEDYDLGDVADKIRFEELVEGKYVLNIEVIDTQGETYKAKRQNFDVIREVGTYKDVAKNHKNYEAIKKLSKDGVLAGYEDGNFKPENSVTRAEFVKIICEAFKLSGIGSRQNFEDVVDHWAKEYIEICSGRGLVNGISATHFSPDTTVTYQQAAKILAILKGYNEPINNNEHWATGYVSYAFKNNIFTATDVETGSLKDISYYDKDATRADVAQMAYNVGDAAVLLNDNALYFKQTKRYCTLDAMAMVFRRKAVLDGNSNWRVITEDSMKEINWVTAGLVGSPKYSDGLNGLNMVATSEKLGGTASEKNRRLKEFLDKYPEGIVLYLYNGSEWMHAVTLTHYDSNGEFYCVDPSGTSVGIINLMESTLTDKRHANTNTLSGLLSYTVKIWYIAKSNNIAM